MNQDINRRDFTRLTAAAFGGIVAGTTIGCGQTAEQQPSAGEGAGAATGNGDAGGDTQEVSLLLQEPHVCRGLNTCEGKGAGGDNACAGQGTCATVEAHSCSGMNECKGQGGCGASMGTNACKGEGGCHVPLEHGWEGVRAKFEEAMQAAGMEFGDAPDA